MGEELFENKISISHTKNCIIYTNLAYWSRWFLSKGDAVPLHLVARPRYSRIRWTHSQLPQEDQGSAQNNKGTNPSTLQVIKNKLSLMYHATVSNSLIKITIPHGKTFGEHL